MTNLHSFKFSNGLSFKYFISNKELKGEDRHVVTESLVKYLENLGIMSIISKEGSKPDYKDIDFGDLSESIKAKFGDVALFAVLDGHSGFDSPQKMFDQIAENLILALNERV
jgi:hypothetical protein